MGNQATSHLHPQKSTVTKVSTMVLIQWSTIVDTFVTDIQVSPWKLLLEGLFKVQMVLPSKVLRLYICSKYE